MNSTFETFVQKLPPVDWHVDVHTHMAFVQNNMQTYLQTTIPPTKKALRKVMSDSTWQVVQEKREVRSQLAQCNRQQRLLLLTACFCAWRDVQSECLSGFAANQRQLDVHSAKLLHDFRRLGRLVTEAIRRDESPVFLRL